MFGSKVTQWGYRIGKTEKWCESKSEAQTAVKRMSRNLKRGGTAPKLVQRQVPAKAKKAAKAENKCSGGTCKRNGYCRKHARETARGSEYRLPDVGVQPIRRPDGKPF